MHNSKMQFNFIIYIIVALNPSFISLHAQIALIFNSAIVAPLGKPIAEAHPFSSNLLLLLYSLYELIVFGEKSLIKLLHRAVSYGCGLH